MWSAPMGRCTRSLGGLVRAFVLHLVAFGMLLLNSIIAGFHQTGMGHDGAIMPVHGFALLVRDIMSRYPDCVFPRSSGGRI